MKTPFFLGKIRHFSTLFAPQKTGRAPASHTAVVHREARQRVGLQGRVTWWFHGIQKGDSYHTMWKIDGEIYGKYMENIGGKQ